MFSFLLKIKEKFYSASVQQKQVFAPIENPEILSFKSDFIFDDFSYLPVNFNESTLAFDFDFILIGFSDQRQEFCTIAKIRFEDEMESFYQAVVYEYAEIPEIHFFIQQCLKAPTETLSQFLKVIDLIEPVGRYCIDKPDITLLN